MKPVLLLALFVASTLQCMELATSSQILSQPDIIKLIAYALVDTAQQGSLVDDPSRGCKADKQLLVALQNFSATNKKIHDIVYKLRCGTDKEVINEAIDFNCHFYTRMGGRLTTAAFMGTPWALTIVLGERYKQLETKYGKKKALEELNILLGARTKHVPLHSGLNFTDMPPSYRGPMPSTITGYAVEYESIGTTIVKFPPSTRKFIIKLIE